MNALEDAVWASLPRLLSLIDRAPFSTRLGSADRAYWHYRVDKDYPSATFAQVAWPLATLAARPELLRDRLDAGLRARLADLALAAMAWWASVGHGDGSFDEWFRHERSHVATAFTALGIAEAALTLGPRFAGSDLRHEILGALERAAAWLGQNQDRDVANHAAGAVAALAAIHQLLPGIGAGAAARTELDRLLALQDPEGFFPEYGGADPGYSTVTHALLASVARRLPTPRLDAALARLEAFLAPFVNPDSSFGGEHGRRATRYAWLGGLALRARESGLAAGMLARLLGGLERGTLPSPLAFDDRYFVFFALPDLVATLVARAELPSRPPEASPLGEHVRFPRAGIEIHRRGALHLVFGGACGGVTKLWLAEPPHRLLYDDCGYSGVLGSGQRVASWQWHPPAGTDAASLEARTELCGWSRESPIERHAIAFRIFNRTLGRVPAASAWVARRARRRWIGGGRRTGIELVRVVALTGDRLTVTDRFQLPERLAPQAFPERLQRVAAFAPVHVPSAPLWLPAFEPALPALGPDLVALLGRDPALTLSTTIAFQDRRASLRVAVGVRCLQEVEITIDPGQGG